MDTAAVIFDVCLLVLPTGGTAAFVDGAVTWSAADVGVAAVETSFFIQVRF